MLNYVLTAYSLTFVSVVIIFLYSIVGVGDTALVVGIIVWDIAVW